MRLGRKWWVVIVAGAASVGAIVAVTSATWGAQTVWTENFNGSAGAGPDPAAWTAEVGGNGWGNAELECYTDTRSNSALDGHGNLIITARSQAGHVCADGTHRQYTSARLTTLGHKSFEYGTISVRAKLPTGPGIWPAIWLLGSNKAGVGWPKCGEIDVAEVIGSKPAVVHGSLHGPTAGGKPYSVTGTYTSPTPLTDGFHVYAVTWSASSVKFSVDGHDYETVTKAQVMAAGAWVFDQPFYLMLNVAVGGTWPGPPTGATSFPQRMIVDYVHVSQ